MCIWVTAALLIPWVHPQEGLPGISTLCQAPQGQMKRQCVQLSRRHAPQVLTSHQGDQTPRSSTSQPCPLLRLRLRLRLEGWCGKGSGTGPPEPDSLLKMLPASFQRASQGPGASLGCLPSTCCRPPGRPNVPNAEGSLLTWHHLLEGILPKLFSLSLSFIPLLLFPKT